MPAILVASKMKSGLPKPVHSAAPILHVPTARTIPQPCYLKFGNKVEVTKPSYSSQIPLKSPHGHENAGDGFPPRKSNSLENGFDTQVRKVWCFGRCVCVCVCVCREVVFGGGVAIFGGGRR
ncbi:calbindin [Platysternon megacephalum]|uniref:Calbindin n=1 Tax=Platysternon megacephalum TaxID=55544 RepID=A0A4D9F0P5_9SAUR|nr:calbindin [Platysternon megacephalum]